MSPVGDVGNSFYARNSRDCMRTFPQKNAFKPRNATAAIPCFKTCSGDGPETTIGSEASDTHMVALSTEARSKLKYVQVSSLNRLSNIANDPGTVLRWLCLNSNPSRGFHLPNALRAAWLQEWRRATASGACSRPLTGTQPSLPAADHTCH